MKQGGPPCFIILIDVFNNLCLRHLSSLRLDMIPHVVQVCFCDFLVYVIACVICCAIVAPLKSFTVGMHSEVASMIGRTCPPRASIKIKKQTPHPVFRVEP